MDHAYVSSTPVFVPPRIPYLCEVPYDGLDFTGYPQRRGWDKERLSRGDFTQHPRERTAAFLQEWLYFGVLTEVLGTRFFDLSSFLAKDADSGETILNSKELPHSVVQWEKSLYEGDESSGLESFRRMNECFKEASHYSRFISVELYNSGGSGAPVSPEIALSLQYLSATLHRPFLDHYPRHRDVKRFWTLMHAVERYHWGRPYLVDAVMAENGWCPSDVNRVFSSADLYRDGVVDLVFACSIGRNNTGVSHAECTNEICSANNIDDAVYQTSHNKDIPNCQCEHVPVPIDKVKRILKHGGIPLVTVKLSQDGKIEALDVCAYRVGIKYTAFSHVWSDGLGNVANNSLPHCQLYRLQSFVSQIEFKYPRDAGWKKQTITAPVGKILSARLVQNPGYFWIDTLCIPLELRYRKLAIARMRLTYAAARWVLVLDSELLAVTTEGLTIRELSLRMVRSGHMRRVWTLQVGGGSKYHCVPAN